MDVAEVKNEVDLIVLNSNEVLELIKRMHKANDRSSEECVGSVRREIVLLKDVMAEVEVEAIVLSIVDKRVPGTVAQVEKHITSMGESAEAGKRTLVDLLDFLKDHPVLLDSSTQHIESVRRDLEGYRLAFSDALGALRRVVQPHRRFAGIEEKLLKHECTANEILALMKRYTGEQENEIIQLESIRSLITKYINPNDKEEVITQVLDAMELYSSNVALQKCACVLLRDEFKFLNSSEVKHRVVVATEAAMMNHKNEPVLLVEAVKLFCFMAYLDGYRRLIINEADSGNKIWSNVIEVTQQHIDHPDIQKWSCMFVALLADKEKTYQVPLMQMSIDSIVRSLKRPNQSIDTLALALSALQNLCQNQRNRITFQEMGVDTDIIFVMRQHPDNSRVQLAGCGALFYYVTHSLCLHSLLEVDGSIETILEAMDTHRYDYGVQMGAILLLLQLSGDDTAIKKQLIDMNAIKRLNKVVRKHEGAARDLAKHAIRNILDVEFE
mmetsp:Transcript_3973/g.5329  ORF Transcript_3973/g.5329 Transcript_3973/m.5329 type:complete len:497 (-) Transcript_3973:85-1575(-)|eukprot:CAMPEP_0184007324 /NCGR_PEP_ID=MMETSP0954-20121128/1259_1 /TAXON_ID=627963 /ORGANISM="Aplanochytrium sp, Strain PBS07" /LENGTH=496 /DNA_ID=CAMNT_0026286119 /DNA_START=130 /DNA_END=1620 /DNA_ORIENTATION=-